MKMMVKDDLNLTNQVCFPIYALAKEVINKYRPLLEKLGITYPQYLVMIVLWQEKEQTVNQLGEKLSLDSGTLTPLLKRLEQKELVTRQRSTTDERVVNIALTKNGEKLKEKARCIPEKLMETMPVSVEELTTLKNIINKIMNK